MSKAKLLLIIFLFIAFFLEKAESVHAVSNVSNHQYYIEVSNQQLIIETDLNGILNFEVEERSAEMIDNLYNLEDSQIKYYQIEAEDWQKNPLEEIGQSTLYLSSDKPPYQIVYFDTDQSKWFNIPFSYQDQTIIFGLEKKGLIGIVFKEDNKRIGINQEYIDPVIHRSDIKWIVLILILISLYFIASFQFLKIPWHFK
ncbi:hypothetical protein ACQV2X_06695 [Facklamia sp. P12945]|uniref:hypothetical protein n=1 Tax=Facklamia sp. P12945 TaxID=3421950 RepID=UPI003D16D91D